jgi:hypothetical protein
VAVSEGYCLKLVMIRQMRKAPRIEIIVPFEERVRHTLTTYEVDPTLYTLHPTPYTLHPILCFYPTPYTLHPTSHTLFLPYTPHPTSHTLFLPYTLCPTPYTLHQELGKDTVEPKP